MINLGRLNTNFSTYSTILAASEMFKADIDISTRVLTEFFRSVWEKY